MLNRLVHGYLPTFQDHVRPSVLGGTAGRKILTLTNARPRVHGEDEEEAPRSPATDAHVRDFFDAWQMGDEGCLKEALNKVVQNWRADNAAGGVPVHAHLPLPKDFAKTLAQLVGETAEVKQSDTFSSVIEMFEPAVRRLAGQQIAGAVGQIGRSAERKMEEERGSTRIPPSGATLSRRSQAFRGSYEPLLSTRPLQELRQLREQLSEASVAGETGIDDDEQSSGRRSPKRWSDNARVPSGTRARAGHSYSSSMIPTRPSNMYRRSSGRTLTGPFSAASR